MVKLPWELFTPFSDFLRNLPSNSSGLNGNRDDEEEEDEDEMQAHQDSMQRLRVSCACFRVSLKPKSSKGGKGYFVRG